MKPLILNENVEFLLRKMAVPLILNNLIFFIYNLADGAWVSGIGINALSAVGIFFPLFMIVVAFSMGISVAMSSAVSRGIGGRRKSDTRMYISQGFILVLFLYVFVLALHLFLRKILIVLGAYGEVLKLSGEYGSVMLIGSIFLLLNNLFSGIINAEGNTKLTLLANAAGSLLNISLDPVFIYVFDLGVKGAAIASVVSTSFSTALFIYMFASGRTHIKMDVDVIKIRYSFPHLFDILRVSIPAAFSMISISIGSLILNRIIVSTTGYLYVAAFTSAWRVIQLGFTPLFGFAGALNPIVELNHTPSRCKRSNV